MGVIIFKYISRHHSTHYTNATIKQYIQSSCVMHTKYITHDEHSVFFAYSVFFNNVHEQFIYYSNVTFIH